MGMIHNAFIPFGDIAGIQLPMDPAIKGHRGFGFVEFEDHDDVEHAIFNMDGAELQGRTLRVNLAKHFQERIDSNNPVWSNTDEYVETLRKDKEKEKNQN